MPRAPKKTIKKNDESSASEINNFDSGSHGANHNSKRFIIDSQTTK